MPQSAAIVVENNFIRGLNTDATGLSFPEGFVNETLNCEFKETGNVKRRLGIDYEEFYIGTQIPVSTLGSTTGAAFSNYVWKDANGVDLVVVQAGEILYFYENNGINSISSQLRTQINLFSFATDGTAITTVRQEECQFADGNGFLFVFHPHVEPIFCEYNGSEVIGNAITIRVRDFDGIDEPGVDEDHRPLALTNIHKYNLANQGWNKTWEGSSTTSLTVGVGVKVLVTQSTLPIRDGDRVRIFDSTSPKITTNSMVGVVTSYVGTVLTVNVTAITGAGTIANWTITPEPAYVGLWRDQVGNYPSDSDVWWRFKTSSNVFEPETMVDKVTSGGGPATKGFFILDAFDQQRDEAYGLEGLVDDVNSGGVRPITGAWFAGRVWYAGVNVNGFKENIYFSQIIENTNQFGRCYQTNDPTSETFFDLLPSDGGVIKIQGAGLIKKLFPMINGLMVFGSQGVWFITGSQGIGFTATDYTVTKISEVSTLSPTSFVNVLGMPMWWNEDGIQTIEAAQNQMNAVSLTFNRLQRFYNDIPLESKRFARGAYNPITKTVEWGFNSNNPTSLNASYEFNNILNFNTVTNSFYVYEISPGAQGTGSQRDTFICGFVLVDLTDAEAAVLEASKGIKYVTRYPVNNRMAIIFSILRNEDHLDWFTRNETGTSYLSSITAGYRPYGRALSKFQIPYIDIHSQVDDVESRCNVQACWDGFTSDASGHWTLPQNVIFNDINRKFQSRRRRIRGNGLFVQLKFSSVEDYPMSVIGWSSLLFIAGGP